jgi:UDP-glucose 4-epimerase
MAVIWITGAHGFIGRALSRHLADLGHEVYGIGHGHWTVQQAQAAGLRLWLNSEVSAASLGQFSMSVPRPETIYHLAGGSSVGAALQNPYDDFHRTVGTTQELLEWIRQSSPSSGLVAVSSAAVYGSRHTAPISESAIPDPFSTYGFHKLMMENVCRNYSQNFGVRIVIARLFSVYGPGLQKQLLWDLCTKLMRDPVVELGGTGLETRDWIHIHDARRALAALSEHVSVDLPIFNLAAGLSSSVCSIAEAVLHQWFSADLSADTDDSRRQRVQFSGVCRPGDPEQLVADVSRLNALGYSCSIPLAQGLGDYVAWFRKHQQISFFA